MFLDTLRFLAERKTYNNVVSESAVFFKNPSISDIRGFQVERFNRVWEDACAGIPFYREYKEKNNLPNRIADVRELMDWPVISKKDIMQAPEKLLRAEPPDSFVITSGSTGIPLKLPVKRGFSTQYNMFIGRAANGILPGGKTFIIWGHHHLYGTGIRRYINIAARNVKDYVLNYKRVSAYDTSVKAMNAAYKQYVRFRPELVIGYSSSILSFVRCNMDKDNRVSPKLVLCTAGPLSPGEREEIRRFFKSPLCMEYGSMECGVMAYSVDNVSHYNVFWNSHILQGVTDENGNVRNIVTTITPKYFPLIRYDIGDCLDIPEGEDMSDILKLNAIVGRPTDVIELPNGVSFFAMLVEACVEHLDGIIAHQVIVRGDELEILIVGTKKYSPAEISSVRSKLTNIIPAIAEIKADIRQVDNLRKNRGGKTPLVIRE